MPYKKKNAKIMYINKCSSHPKSIINQIRKIINQRLIKRSSNEENFKDKARLRTNNEKMRLQ